MNKDKYNKSGYKDLTAYYAIQNIEREEKETERRKKLLSTIFYIADLAGYRIEGRISLKDKKSGKIWR